VPGLDCESVEFSLVHVGLTQISGPNEPLGLQYLSCNLFRGPRTCPAGLLFMLAPHWWLARAVFTRSPGYLGLLRPPSRRDRERHGRSPTDKYGWGAYGCRPDVDSHFANSLRSPPRRLRTLGTFNA
jgi:hypothetical protein